MNEHDQFRSWLTANEAILRGRSVDEIADIAIACGFSRLIVTPWQTSQNFKAIPHE